jgi:hypothetical protein
MTVCIMALVLSVISVTPEAETTAAYGEPDIYETTLLEYIHPGSNNFEMKMLMNVYLDSLETELERLHLELADMFGKCPELLEALETSHALFLEESRAWAYLSEETVWWDIEEGVRYDGSGRSYTYAFTLADAERNRINEYWEMMGTGNAAE